MGIGPNLHLCAGKQSDNREERNCLVCDFCVSILNGYESGYIPGIKTRQQVLRILSDTAGAEVSAE